MFRNIALSNIPPGRIYIPPACPNLLCIDQRYISHLHSTSASVGYAVVTINDSFDFSRMGASYTEKGLIWIADLTRLSLLHQFIPRGFMPRPGTPRDGRMQQAGTDYFRHVERPAKIGLDTSPALWLHDHVHSVILLIGRMLMGYSQLAAGRY